MIKYRVEQLGKMDFRSHKDVLSPMRCSSDFFGNAVFFL